MATTRYFEFIELQYDKLTEQINQWLRYTYNKADIQFNSASPYGQIINVLKELFQQNILYLKNSMKVLDIETSENKKVIQQTARIAGHNPGRAISATGTLRFKLKAGVEYRKEIKDEVISIPNKLLLKNINNSLNYVAKLNQDENQYTVNLPDMQFFLPIIQGKYESQDFTGDGTINQSFSVNIPNSAQIENFNYVITYNSIVLEVKDHLYDMLPKEFACYVRSGFNGGLDIYFGTNHYGFVPQLGSSISIEYLLSNGSVGEILNPTVNEWKIEGDIKDGQGNPIKVENLFDIFIENDVNFASDGESVQFTKAIIPYVSRNFVLATPNQYIFHLKRLNLFSKVNAFNMLDDNNFGITNEVLEMSVNKIKNAVSSNKSNAEILASVNNFQSIYSKYKTNMNDNTIFLYLIPDITKYFNDAVNYFNIPYDVFTLDQEEQDKTLSYLRRLGTTSISTTTKIIQPKISKYVMHVYVRRYDNANESNIKQEIITKTSDYLLKNNRFDRIPKSDFIQIYKDIDGIDSVSLYFVSEKNEDFHRKKEILHYEKTTIVVPKTKLPKNMAKPLNTNKMSIMSSRKSVFSINAQQLLQKPNKIENGVIISAYQKSSELVGIDPVHGDIIIEKDEYAIIRGGFRDRKGIWYSENPNENMLNSINVTFDGITEK